jgi:hypothetical protein
VGGNAGRCGQGGVGVRRAAVFGCVLAVLGGSAPALAQEPARVNVTATPRALQFADELQVRVEVVVDPDLADPASIELESEFQPFEIETIRRETEEGFELSGTEFAVELRCLAASCLPRRGSERRSFEFPPVRVHIDGEDGERTLEAPVPPVRVATRLSAREVGDGEGWSYDDRELAPVDYPVSPGLATALLWVCAVALALLSGALVVYAITGRDPRDALAPRRGTPLERALALARRASSREPKERRKALERLARELGRAGHPDLAERSGDLAWSRPEPPGAAIGVLIADVERAREAGA